MDLQWRHKDGIDFIILVKDGMVTSEWHADPATVKAFIAILNPIDAWEDQFGIFPNPEFYGELVGERTHNNFFFGDFNLFESRMIFFDFIEENAI